MASGTERRTEVPVRAPSRAGTVVAYALVLVLAAELAVWEAFLVPVRGFGVPLPVAPVLAVVGNVVLGRAGARVLGTRLGAVLPGLIWLLLALAFSPRRPEGDLVVQGTLTGYAFLIGGTVAATAVSVLVGVRATPGAVPGR